MKKSRFQEYIDYFRKNPKGYWFKRRLFGWGWVPVKWQGWAVVLGYVVALLLIGFTINEDAAGNELFFTFFLPLILLTIMLIVICYKKGEKPKWMWGLPSKKK